MYTRPIEYTRDRVWTREQGFILAMAKKERGQGERKKNTSKLGDTQPCERRWGVCGDENEKGASKRARQTGVRRRQSYDQVGQPAVFGAIATSGRSRPRLRCVSYSVAGCPAQLQRW